jgi:hybrid cluster-associated redox disulfide protein
MENGRMENDRMENRGMEDQMREQNTITADMSIIEVVQKHPNTISVFMRHGLGCIGCAMARFENIREGAEVHGIDVDALVKDLNQAAVQA